MHRRDVQLGDATTEQLFEEITSRRSSSAVVVIISGPCSGGDAGSFTLFRDGSLAEQLFITETALEIVAREREDCQHALVEHYTGYSEGEDDEEYD